MKSWARWLRGRIFSRCTWNRMLFQFPFWYILEYHVFDLCITVWIRGSDLRLPFYLSETVSLWWLVWVNGGYYFLFTMYSKYFYGGIRSLCSYFAQSFELFRRGESVRQLCDIVTIFLKFHSYSLIGRARSQYLSDLFDKPFRIFLPFFEEDCKICCWSWWKPSKLVTCLGGR